MKDLTYSLIDQITDSIDIEKDYLNALKDIQWNLKKGKGSFSVGLKHTENINRICDHGFDYVATGYHWWHIFSGVKTYEYKLRVK